MPAPNQVNPTTGNAQRKFRKRLLAWYGANKRDLPWRRDRDPYRVWLSEIMLQQTRVAAVLEHYRQFLLRFPTVQKLAAARESSVLAAWSGLGYYRRARMMHAAAKQIVAEHGATFPCSAEKLRELPGIGRYTAAAIASIAFGEAVAVVDGNVARVLQRLSAKNLSGENLWQQADALLDHSRPGDFNQAMMELGATVCLPKQPKCPLCPVIELCATRGEMTKSAKTTRQKKREIHYALARRNGSVFLLRRSEEASLMPGMWELPEIPASTRDKPTLTLRHSITVTDYTVRVREECVPENTSGQWIARSRLNSMALTGLARKILRAAQVI
jgi:A/G-specific adenine glycosylase